jgi:hypothetical protein
LHAERVQAAVDSAVFQSPALVRFSVRNETTETIVVSRCGSRVLPAIERLRLGQWKNAAAAICLASLSMVAAELRSGETLADSIRIEDPAQYRLVISYGSGDLRVFRLSASTAFLVQ